MSSLLLVTTMVLLHDDVRNVPSGDEDLRIICTFGVITGLQSSDFKRYERRNGCPILPGSDFNKPTKEGRERWKKNFVKSTWKNSKTAVLRRREHPKSDLIKHANSLPRDFSIHDYIQLRRSVLASRHLYPELPDWTEEHYNSQFLQTGTSRLSQEAFSRLVCNERMGGVKLLGGDTTMEGKHVKWHLRVSLDEGGHGHFECDGVWFQLLRTPRSRVEKGRAVDTIQISVNTGDTSRPYTHLTTPYVISEDKEKIFLSIRNSVHLQVQYALKRREYYDLDLKLMNDAKLMAEQNFVAKLENIGDHKKTFCIEVDHVRFRPGVLQNEDLVAHFEHGLSTGRIVAEGEVEHSNGASSSYALQGVEMEIAIAGRDDALKKEETQQEFLARQMEGVTISGELE